jgi:nucleoside-diphosphate-sugar epimerase
VSRAPEVSDTALVAGGAGFVGSALVRRLVADGARVVVLDSFFSGRRRHVEGLGDAVTVVAGDVLDERALARVFERHRPGHVYHLVGDTFVPSAYEEPRRFFRINVEGTLAVLQAVRRFGARRMLYVSSTEVYGRAERQPLVETDRLAPANTYAVSKLAADQLCSTFFHEHGVPVAIARIFNCYGPRETQPYVVPEVIRQLAKGPVVALGDADARRDLTYVEDTARGLVALMRSDLPNGEPVHVGSGVSYAVREVAEVCARLLGHARAEVVLDPARLRRRDVAEFRCDASRLRAATGWAPTVGLEDGLRRTVEWFVANGRRWAWEDWCPDGVVGPGVVGRSAEDAASAGAVTDRARRDPAGTS